MYTVVFIDDNPDFLDLMQQQVDIPQVQVHTILDKTNKDIIQSIIDVQPDFLFIDLYIVSMAVVQLCHALRAHEQTKDIPFYLMSFVERGEILNAAPDTGALGAVTKPLSNETIKDILSRHLNF